MKKSNIIFLMVVQVIMLFILSNIFTLFKPLEKKEMDSVIEKAEMFAELMVTKFKNDIPKMEETGYFDHIAPSKATEYANSTIKAGDIQVYSIHKPVPGMDNQALEFKKEITSLGLTMMKKLNRTFFNLSVLVAIFLVLTSFYLIYLIKKDKGPEREKAIPPLQDYLLELKGAEQQLKNKVEEQRASVTRQDELNKSIINNINAAVILLNQAGRIDIFNAVAERLFNQSYAHAKNNYLGNVLERFPALLKFARESGDKPGSAEVTQGERVFALDLLPIENVGTLLLIKDITEEKRREDIARSNKNFIMLGEMTAYLAHEIRNSLGIIYGYTKTIKPGKNEQEQENLEQKIAKVNKEINFLSNMMETFLNFSRPIRVEKREKINLERLLTDIASEKGLTLKYAGNDVLLENDSTLLHSVFSNLFLNAGEAGAGSVEVHARQNGQVEILVSDNGNGIEDKSRDKIWFPFFTTKDKGTGMGLAIIRKIITALNGDITLQESSPRGTTFKIVFYN